MRKMLPRTEYYMQQILPQLTGGRYHDVELTTEPEEGAISGGPIQLRVWETAAEQYIPKTALSGGAADANSFNERGLRCVNLANGMTDIHTPNERIAVEDLEGMVDVTLALIETARAA